MSAALPVEDGWQLLAEDLRTLAWLHAGEQPAPLWLALQQTGFPAGLSVVPPADAAVAGMADALHGLGPAYADNPRRIDDELAADYAGIYLTHALQASPLESVWRDEDHLMLQGPTFEVRQAYRQHGLAAADWRSLPDDHLTNELSFVAALLEKRALAESQDFLAHHLLAWLPQFAQRVAQRAATPVYAALALLTLRACQRLHESLAGAVPAPAPVSIEVSAHPAD